LKPENYEYDPKDMHISDFGIYYIGQLASTTNTAIVKGSREYLAPEIQNFTNLIPTTMSDIWAVGVIGYEMCMGIGLTWNTDVFQEIKHHIHGYGLNLRHVPERFGGVIHQVLGYCMSYDPTQRPNATALRDHLRGLIQTMDMNEWQAAQNVKPDIYGGT
jgi:serine/threonine protein kinase